jgi:membrane protein YdbS with pleckstrin-like domain
MRSKLRDHERRLFETRTHWLSMWKPFLVFLATAVFLYFAYFWSSPGSSTPALRKISLVLFVLGGLYFAYRELYRRRDIWVVTNLRVIDERGIFTLFTKESPLEKINNLSYEQNIIGRMLNYGQIEIQTAAEDGATIYTLITNPKRLKEEIATARDAYSKELLQSSLGHTISQA